MKKIKLLMIALVVFASYNCKDAKKSSEKAVENSEKEEGYSVLEDSAIISFTAYKTTAKKPVGGVFKKVNITNTPVASSPIAALNGMEFSILVSSLFTNDDTGTRDPKILLSFFGVMADTEFISGTFSIGENEKCMVNLKLNGESHDLPLEYEITDDNHVNFNGVLNLEKWKALDALASLNKACGILHTGDDGISKTWNDVAIEATILIQKN